MRRIILFAIIAFVVSCSTTTSITGSWKADDYKKDVDFKKIAVVALAKNQADKLIVEKTFVERLKFLGYDAIVTADFLVPSVVKKENAKMIDELLKERGADAVMLLSLLNVKDDVRYVQGSTPYGPGAYYGGYYGYYYYNYDRMNSGYYEKTTSIFLESKFYDLSSGKLISSVQTETVDPAGTDDLAASFSQTILKKLLSDKILINNSKK